jgi:WD40 repeat protein
MEDGTARIFDSASGNSLMTYRGHTSGVLSMSWSADGSRIASACREQTLQIWDPRTGAELLVSNNHDSPAIWSPDGRTLVSETIGNALEIRAARGPELSGSRISSPATRSGTVR